MLRVFSILQDARKKAFKYLVNITFKNRAILYKNSFTVRCNFKPITLYVPQN